MMIASGAAAAARARLPAAACRALSVLSGGSSTSPTMRACSSIAASAASTRRRALSVLSGGSSTSPMMRAVPVPGSPRSGIAGSGAGAPLPPLPPPRRRAMSTECPAPTVKVFDTSTGPDPDAPLVASLDVGTSSTRIILFDAAGSPVGSAQAEFVQIYPKPGSGWHEHDPLMIWEQSARNVEALAAAAPHLFAPGRIKGVGVTNMRETTIAWNHRTGRPYYNAIIWDDLRTADIASVMAAEDGDLGADRFRAETGLPLASYFSGTKMRWLVENVPDLRRDLADPAERGNVRFGTVDTWLVYQMTGGSTYVTDITNASRTMLMNVQDFKYEDKLVSAFFGDVDVPQTALPEIVSCSETVGEVKASAAPALAGIPICGIIGDQQGALFGQTGFQAGDAKCTYGTGMFLMMNTGTECVPSKHGLLTTPAYKLGPDAEVVYALEGSVSHSGSLIQWLRDRLEIISDAKESEELARTVPSNEGLYFVPAFAGLFAPYWRSDARGCIVGMTAGHHKGHVCRAALEASPFQARALLDAMSNDSGRELSVLKVDGGMSMNELAMQFQSDIIGRNVVRPTVVDTTCMGAAFCAGLAVGVWKDTDEIAGLWAADRTWSPEMEELERERNWKGWNKAVSKSFDWVVDE